ncbi:hypothetical protein OGAPHI_002560 [Ogataea philodendri]|uniref:Uncharacterized protein n=1 Tax=Ogataea philodendri TaxID=1378263 RepID=A0A9P8PBT5_9ASCO|nr:uncharacterized protein OGAPHI_002560 [Ogataea philodendri]KAH3668805.1 hypothetical protein OGAPHI_002560 [Ogataea philodendri]
MSDYDVPGGFPSLQSREFTLKTPPRIRSEMKTSTPSSGAFKFTPTHGKKLYPTIVLSPTDGSDSNTSYQEKDNASFTKEMDYLQTKLFSSKLTSSVLTELNDRYQKVRNDNILNIQKLNATSPKPLNRRPSSRYASDHRGRFNRLESISSHYAARRARQPPTENKQPARKVFEGPEHQTRKTPNDKRLGLQDLGSASKRLRVLDGYKEVVESVESPTRPQEEKQKIMEQQLNRQRGEQPVLGSLPRLQFSRPSSGSVASKPASKPASKLPSYLQPTKSSIQRSESKPRLNTSESTSHLPRLSNIVRSKTMQEISPSRMNKISTNTQAPLGLAQKPQSRVPSLSKSASSMSLARKSSIPQLARPTVKKDVSRPWRN